MICSYKSIFHIKYIQKIDMKINMLNLIDIFNLITYLIYMLNLHVKFNLHQFN